MSTICTEFESDSEEPAKATSDKILSLMQQVGLNFRGKTVRKVFVDLIFRGIAARIHAVHATEWSSFIIFIRDQMSNVSSELWVPSESVTLLD